MQSSKDQILEIFKKFDLNGDNSIDKEEVKQVAKELGQELSQFELNKIFTLLDVNNDGTISFDEFYTWWYYGKVNKLTELVQLKMGTLKLLQKADHKMKKLVEGSNEKFANLNANGFFSLKCGEFAPKDTFGVKFVAGQEADNHSKNILKGLQQINEKLPSVVFKVKCKDATQAQQALQNIIDNLMIMAESFVPEEIASAILPQIKFDYFVENEYLTVGIQLDLDIIQDTVLPLIGFLDTYFNEDCSAFVSFAISLGIDGNDLHANQAKPVIEFLGKGIQFTIESQINAGLLSKIRQIYYDKLVKFVEKNDNSAFSKQIKKAVLLALFQSAKIELNFRNTQNVHQELQNMGPPLPTFGQLSDLFKQTANPQAMMQEIPILQEAVDLFKNHFCGEFTLSFQTNKAAAYLYGASEGYSKILNLFI